MTAGGGVDVLATLDFLTTAYVANVGTTSQFISCITPNCFGDDAKLRENKYGAAWLDLIEARAAIAELIAADKEYDEAEAEWREAEINSSGDESPGAWRKAAAKAWQRFGAATARRASALAALESHP